MDDASKKYRVESQGFMSFVLKLFNSRTFKDESTIHHEFYGTIHIATRKGNELSNDAKKNIIRNTESYGKSKLDPIKVNRDTSVLILTSSSRNQIQRRKNSTVGDAEDVDPFLR